MSPAFQFLQPFIASLISTLRAPKSREGYEAIGGGSPLRRITQEQADALTQSLRAKGLDAQSYVAMRYWFPFTEEALEQVKKVSSLERCIHHFGAPLLVHYVVAMASFVHEYPGGKAQGRHSVLCMHQRLSYACCWRLPLAGAAQRIPIPDPPCCSSTSLPCRSPEAPPKA